MTVTCLSLRVFPDNEIVDFFVALVAPADDHVQVGRRSDTACFGSLASHLLPVLPVLVRRELVVEGASHLFLKRSVLIVIGETIAAAVDR